MSDLMLPEQPELFDSAELEALSHPRTNGFFSILFPRSQIETHRDVSAIQGKIFSYLAGDDVPPLESCSQNLVTLINGIVADRATGTSRRALDQRSFGLQHFKTVVTMCQGRPDHYVSQADFIRPNRLAVNLLRTSSLWLDLDIYKSLLAEFAEDEAYVVEAVIECCEKNNIPHPSVIIRSGRGYYVKWFTESLPASAFPRVRAAMSYLCDAFMAFGADKSATDSSRVLRACGTTNSKNDGVVRFIYTNTSAEYVFNDLANAILPIKRTIEQAERWRMGREIKKKIDARNIDLEAFYKKLKYDPRKARVNAMAFKPGSREQSLWWSRMLDFRKLMELRGESLSQREVMTFLMMNALAWSGQVTEGTFWNQAQEIAASMPRQKTMDKPKETLSSMYKRTVAALDGQTQEYKGKQVSALYRYKNETLIEQLCVTTEEMPHMLTLIDSKEIRKRKLKSQRETARAKGVTTRDEYLATHAERRGLALHIRQEGLSWAAIGGKLGISDKAARMLASRAE